MHTSTLQLPTPETETLPSFICPSHLSPHPAKLGEEGGQLSRGKDASVLIFFHLKISQKANTTSMCQNVQGNCNACWAT